MLYLYIFLAVSLVFLIYMRIETTLLQVKRVSFTKNTQALKIMQLSDIHISRFYVSKERLRQVIADEKPDLIVMTGDYIERKKDIPKFIELLEYIGIKDNTYLCFGNHDYKPFRNDKAGLGSYIGKIEATGAKMLLNDCISISKNSKVYNLIGIADIRYGEQNIEKALKKRSSGATANIGFSHNPDIVLEISRGELDYLFCGHFHGGQIWMPFDLEFMLLRDEKLSRQGIKSGLHKVNGINLYINRGLGNVTLPLRFLSRPEVTVFYIP